MNQARYHLAKEMNQGADLEDFPGVQTQENFPLMLGRDLPQDTISVAQQRKELGQEIEANRKGALITM